MTLRRLVSLTAALLVACVGYSPASLPTGATEAEVKRVMGEPTGRYPLADGGQRLEFARGPAGRHTYMLDLDAQGRLTQWEQVLDANHFAEVMQGQTRDQVLRMLGRPGDRVGMFRNGQIWSWRYANNDCLLYQAQFDADGIVTAAGYGLDRGCDGPERAARMLPKH